MQMANWDKAYVEHFVRQVLRIIELPARLALNVFDTLIPIIIGYHFLRMLSVKPDWTARKVELSHQVQSAGSNGTLGHDKRHSRIRFQSMEVPFSWIPEVEYVHPTPDSTLTSTPTPPQKGHQHFESQNLSNHIHTFSIQRSSSRPPTLPGSGAPVTSLTGRCQPSTLQHGDP